MIMHSAQSCPRVFVGRNTEIGRLEDRRARSDKDKETDTSGITSSKSNAHEISTATSLDIPRFPRIGTRQMPQSTDSAVARSFTEEERMMFHDEGGLQCIWISAAKLAIFISQCMVLSIRLRSFYPSRIWAPTRCSPAPLDHSIRLLLRGDGL